MDATGEAGPTPRQARGPHWRLSSHGFFVPSSVELSVDQRILEASAVLPPRGAITGWAALRWQGARWFDGVTLGQQSPVVVLAACRRIRSQRGIQVAAETVPPRLTRMVDGVRVVHPVSATAYEMRHAPHHRYAAIVFCLAAFNDLVSFEEMIEHAGLAPRLGLSSWTGMPQYRDAMGCVSENVWSPQEAAMMLVWILDAGLPAPLMNQPIFDRHGRHLGTPDLLDLEAGVVGEYDGALHLQGRQRRKDIGREERFRDHGLECFVAMAGDLVDRSAMATRMRSARRRARWEPEDARRWTIEPPAWWTPTVTVAQRRALSEQQRALLLRHRAA
jgi:hypothetical protein